MTARTRRVERRRTAVAEPCRGSAPDVKSVDWLRELNGSVEPIPPRATDLSCYIRTLWRQSFVHGHHAKGMEGHGLPEAKQVDYGGPRPGTQASSRSLESKLVAVTVHGELLRLETNSTIARHVVAPLVSQGARVVVFLTLQSSEPMTSSWHVERFVGLDLMETELEKQGKASAAAKRFIDFGAERVHVHLYALERIPPAMPTSKTGGPGHGSVKRFELVFRNYVIFCLLHSNVMRDVEHFENQSGERFDLLVKQQADSYWFRDMPLTSQEGVDIFGAVTVKACMGWNGYNDKFALVPRRFLGPWMKLLEAYYQPDFIENYKNSEMMILRIAERTGTPVRLSKEVSVVTYYHWGLDVQGRRGCFPARYSGASKLGRPCLNKNEIEILKQRECRF